MKVFTSLGAFDGVGCLLKMSGFHLEEVDDKLVLSEDAQREFMEQADRLVEDLQA